MKLQMHKPYGGCQHTRHNAGMDIHLTHSDIRHIERCVQEERQRIQVLETEGAGRVVVKGLRAARLPVLYWIQGMLARVLGLSLLRAVPMHGGRKAMDIELRRLEQLKQAGTCVPRVLHVGADYFVMSWLGAHDLSELLAQKHPDAVDLWRQSGDLLQELHQKNQYLSQAFVRNVVIDTASRPATLAGLIDFEDDPLEVLSLQQAQARDWLLFLHSSLWLLPISEAQMDACIQQWLEAEPEAIRQAFYRACGPLSIFRHLPAKRSWGRDVLALQVAAGAAWRWHRHRQ